MSVLFLGFVNRAITAGWLVLAVLILRLVLRRAPKRLICAMWGLAAVRLALPFSIPSPASLIPSAQTVVPESIHTAHPVIETGIPAVNAAVSSRFQSVYYGGVSATAHTAAHTADTLAVIWIVGAAVMVLYCLGTFLRLRLRLRTAVRLRDNLWQSEWVDSPFVLGLLRPRIYLPFRLSDDDLTAVEAHEQSHIARGDHVWRVLAFLLLALYWFHPLLWVAYFLFYRDLEYACDERVIRTLDGPARQRYSAALLRCAAPRRSAAPCPVAFGEAGVGGRIKSVLHYRKPAFWIVLLAAIALVITAVCFLTDPPVKNAGQWLRTATSARLRDAKLVLNYDGSGQGPEYTFSHFTTEQQETLAKLLRQVNAASLEDAGSRQAPYALCSLYFPGYGVYLSLPSAAGDEVELQYREQVYRVHDRELADFLRGILPGETLTWYQRMFARNALGSDYLIMNLLFACDTVDIHYTDGLLDRGTPPVNILGPDGTSHQSGSAAVLGGSLVTWRPPVWDEEKSFYSGSMTLALSGGVNDGKELTIDLHGTPDYQGSTLVGVTYQLVILNNTLPVTATLEGSSLRLWDGVYDAPEYLSDMRYTDELGAVWFDIDGDGVKEACSMGYGPTSGVFTFTVSARSDGEIKYADVFMPGHWGQNEKGDDVYFPDQGHVAFVQGPNGLQICFTEDVPISPVGGAGVEHLYDISVRDGHIVLTGEDGEMGKWGNP